MDDNPDIYQAGLVAGRLIEALDVPMTIAGAQRTVGASIGISLGRDTTCTAADLMRDADIAMYVAKGKGKGRFSVFEAKTHESVVLGLELRGDLQEAIDEKQFELYYQPVVHLASKAVVGVEALVRWNHPTRGLLQPGDFIPLAETTGAIVPLGRWILERACHDAARWADESKGGEFGIAGDRFVGVNLSAVQLVQPGFADMVASVLAASGLPAERLLLELTETTRLDQEAGSANLAQLEMMGVRLAIDDFGTGWASFSQLRRIPFDIVKIDRSFVQHLTAGSRSESLVSGIIDLARRLGVAVIAEGIESEAQRARLQHLGATFGQGFFLARPMPEAKLRKHLNPAPVRPRSRRALASRPIPPLPAAPADPAARPCTPGVHNRQRRPEPPVKSSPSTRFLHAQRSESRRIGLVRAAACLLCTPSVKGHLTSR